MKVPGSKKPKLVHADKFDRTTYGKLAKRANDALGAEESGNNELERFYEHGIAKIPGATGVSLSTIL